MILQYLFLLLLHLTKVTSYIPAQPSNITAQDVSTSTLHLQWYTNGSDWENITQQLQPSNISRVQGVFVHFSEDNAGNETTTTPWIAFVSCDANSTNSSNETDVFTMAKDRGAKSAVLYSLYSETCVIDPGFQSHVLDVFATQTLNASWRLEYEFGQFGPSSETYYEYFNATILNDAAAIIDDSIDLDYPAAPGFLFATLSAYNVSGSGAQSDSNGTSASTANSGSQNTGVAMIVLYAITGCVSVLFFAVIVSGAIRAIRHPERYGPRAADPALGGGQSRAGGLGKAILDTFPIVKFGVSGTGQDSNLPHAKDIELGPTDTEFESPVLLPDSVQLARLSRAEEHNGSHGAAEDQNGQGVGIDNRSSEGTDQVDLPHQNNVAKYDALCVPASSRETDTRMPECIGRETCPICIVDFEEGDDLRVLPCEGKHRFHQSCVDRWLLELSGSCPICREDFRALETIISGEPGSPVNRHSEAGALQNRFSRYLRFVRRRQRRSSIGDQEALPPE